MNSNNLIAYSEKNLNPHTYSNDGIRASGAPDDDKSNTYRETDRPIYAPIEDLPEESDE